jgi:hypothetical protein
MPTSDGAAHPAATCCWLSAYVLTVVSPETRSGFAQSSAAPMPINGSREQRAERHLANTTTPRAR